MCPICAATVAAVAAGATTAGGLAALLVKKLSAKAGVPTDNDSINLTTQVKGEEHESSESRDA